MYANDLKCRYRVTRVSPSICDLLITILEFKLQEGEVCENDYLQIAEERLCGTIASGMTSKITVTISFFFFLLYTLQIAEIALLSKPCNYFIIILQYNILELNRIYCNVVFT